MHKKFFVLLIGLFLTMSVVSAQEIWKKIKTVEKSIVHLNYGEGDVFFQGQNHEAISERDGLRTEKGRAEVYLGGRNWLRLNQYTRVVFTGLQAGFIQIYVDYGDIYIQAENTIEIQTPHENFSLRDLYRIEVSGDKTRKIRPMYEDDFDKWQHWREKEVNRQVNRPGDLSKFTIFLGSYGRWYYNPLWGWTWRPWRWNLIYSSPWYWTSYYYGRWYRDTSGQYWVPGKNYNRRNAQTVIRKNQLRKPIKKK